MRGTRRERLERTRRMFAAVRGRIHKWANAHFTRHYLRRSLLSMHGIEALRRAEVRLGTGYRQASFC